MLSGKTILITGGTGSFGKAFVEYIFKNYRAIKRVIIFSRDEQKPGTRWLPNSHLKSIQIRYLLGDVRDLERVSEGYERGRYSYPLSSD